MPRKARQKHCEAIYHIMCRSISEFDLFRDNDDKDYYLNLLKRYKEKYKCSIYAYCLMDNHLHLHLDPKGFDVSKFMHCLNTAYVRYYNKKYQRHGHVFQERFESRILDTDQYNLTVSAYIHNNPQDLEGYKGKEEQYKYSSYGIYLGIREDIHGLIDISYIKELLNVKEKFSDKYMSFISHQRVVGNLKELQQKLSTAIENEYISGREIISREMSPSKIITYISGKLLTEVTQKRIKKIRYEYKAFTAYALRLLCGLGYKEICQKIYNITISGCSRLCDHGYELIRNKESIYSTLMSELIGNKCAFL